MTLHPQSEDALPVVPDTAKRSGSTPVAKAQEAQASKQTRLTINLNPEAVSFLKDLTDESGITYTEAIRRALAVYKLVKDETANGHAVQFDDGHRVREIILL